MNILFGSILFYIGIYFAAISLLAIVLTVYDKRAARKGSKRIKEKTLLLVSIIGGSAAMLVIMRLIRHKTKHARFMVGIPIIIAAQIAVVLFIWWWLKGGIL